MRNCPNCGGKIAEKKNSKGMVNFQCVSGQIDPDTGKVCKANGYLRHEGKQKTQTGPTEREPRPETPPVVTPEPEPTPAPTPTPEPTPKPARKRREPRRVNKPEPKPRRTFDF